MLPERSVEVTQACSFAGFLHQSTQLELLAGQQAHMLRIKQETEKEVISHRKQGHTVNLIIPSLQKHELPNTKLPWSGTAPDMISQDFHDSCTYRSRIHRKLCNIYIIKKL